MFAESAGAGEIVVGVLSVLGFGRCDSCSEVVEIGGASITEELIDLPLSRAEALISVGLLMTRLKPSLLTPLVFRSTLEIEDRQLVFEAPFRS